MSLVFLCTHALLHVFDTAVGNLSSDHWWLDFAGVYLPAIILLVLVVHLSRDVDGVVVRVSDRE